MLESLFGAETPLAVRFFIAFIVVFALIGVIAWLVRRFGSGALGAQGSRGRAPRLAVIEAGAVDGRRKLVLIRRDNVEHLIMIGGPADIVIEPNIVRGQNAGRDVAPSRGTGAVETLPRAVPLSDETTWPLQPEVAPRPVRAPRPAVEDALQWPAPPEPKAPAAPALKRPQRASDTLAGLAAELSTRPAPQPEPEISQVRSTQKVEPRIEPRLEPKAEPKVDFAPEPKIDMRPAQPVAATADADSDQNLADMAQRLEAALRRPGGPLAAAAPAAPAVTKPAAEKPAAPEKKPAPAAKPDNVFGSLEEEMASLLGRPPGKT